MNKDRVSGGSRRWAANNMPPKSKQESPLRVRISKIEEKGFNSVEVYRSLKNLKRSLEIGYNSSNKNSRNPETSPNFGSQDLKKAAATT